MKENQLKQLQYAVSALRIVDSMLTSVIIPSKNAIDELFKHQQIVLASLQVAKVIAELEKLISEKGGAL